MMRNENNIHINKRTKGQHSGTIDAAFVPFPNDNWQVSSEIKVSDTEYSSFYAAGDESMIAQGATVYKFGVTSGFTTGTIEYTNYSCRVEYDGESDYTTISNCIRYTNASLSGDSGGPVYVKGEYIGRYAPYYLIACNFAGPVDSENNTFGIGCRITNIINDFNVDIVGSNYTL